LRELVHLHGKYIATENSCALPTTHRNIPKEAFTASKTQRDTERIKSLQVWRPKAPKPLWQSKSAVSSFPTQPVLGVILNIDKMRNGIMANHLKQGHGH
jgi:hypothetical protein